MNVTPSSLSQARLGLRNQTSYGMTITSTASSGGGLPDFGVFQNQKVYTVYLDMRASDDDKAPSWTLQHAPLQQAPDLSSGVSNQSHSAPTPPYAMIVTDALSNWTFQPSQVDGKPIALKIMMGIRLIAR